MDKNHFVHCCGDYLLRRKNAFTINIFGIFIFNDVKTCRLLVFQYEGVADTRFAALLCASLCSLSMNKRIISSHIVEGKGFFHKRADKYCVHIYCIVLDDYLIVNMYIVCGSVNMYVACRSEVPNGYGKTHLGLVQLKIRRKDQLCFQVVIVWNCM